jgi:hypothetical protein
MKKTFSTIQKFGQGIELNSSRLIGVLIKNCYLRDLNNHYRNILKRYEIQS